MIPTYDGAAQAPIFAHLRQDVPNPKQAEFFSATEKYIAYGGARGGGKSWAMRRKFVMLAMRYSGLRLLLLRRTMQELRENHILPLQAELHGYAQYNSDRKDFLFPSGSRLVLGYCDNDNDMMQYQGQEYDVIGFEEATNFEEEWIIFISTCLRSTRTDFSTRIYFTCNPGGPAHGYIKRLFIDRRYRDGEDARDYRFVQANIYDNAVLMDSNPEYIKMLQALPTAKRKAHLDGCWDIYEGQVFEEFRDVPEHYLDRRCTHVITPFDIPPEWRIYRSFDWGYRHPFSVAWWAVDYDGRLYRILELYGCVAGEPNVGVKWDAEKLFGEVARIEREHRWLKGRQINGVADPAIWNAETGVSVADTADKYGVYFDRGDHKRIPGWLQMHYRLAFDSEGLPMMYVFSTCKGFIRTIPLLQYDKNKPEDVDTDGEDHIADEARYMCMAQPMAPRALAPEQKRIFNPLDEPQSRQSSQYATMMQWR